MDRFRLDRLHDRVSLLVTGIAAFVLLLSGLWWGAATRGAIHEEVAAAARVSEQWLKVVGVQAATKGDVSGLLQQLAAVGRLRANVVEVYDREGNLHYRSPEPTYKAGRDAPAWFSRLVAPPFAPRVYELGGVRLVLRPDTSRAALDAWDNLIQIAGWALGLLLIVGFAIHRAIERTFAPLTALQEALEHTADGRFDTRLPRHGVAELDRLSESYNRMAEQLTTTLVHNARLEEDQAFARAVNARLEEERQLVARELHDELGQSITAVRAIAGAIAQRSGEQPSLHGSAQAILAMTGQMQDGVRVILERLRRSESQNVVRLGDAVAQYCAHWAALYPQLKLTPRLDPVERPLDEGYCLTVLRLVQEALTNVARHAEARRVRVRLQAMDGGLRLIVSDDGIGFDAAAGTERYGLTGMRERVSEWGGEIRFERPPAGGTRVCAVLPWPRGAARGGATAVGQLPAPGAVGTAAKGAAPGRE